jgi:hypothetical protein
MGRMLRNLLRMDLGIVDRVRQDLHRLRLPLLLQILPKLLDQFLCYQL